MGTFKSLCLNRIRFYNLTEHVEEGRRKKCDSWKTLSGQTVSLSTLLYHWIGCRQQCLQLILAASSLTAMPPPWFPLPSLATAMGCRIEPDQQQSNKLQIHATGLRIVWLWGLADSPPIRGVLIMDLALPPGIWMKDLTQPRLWFLTFILVLCLIRMKFSQCFDGRFWLRSLHVYTALLLNSIHGDSLPIDGYKEPFALLTGQDTRHDLQGSAQSRKRNNPSELQAHLAI